MFFLLALSRFDICPATATSRRDYQNASTYFFNRVGGIDISNDDKLKLSDEHRVNIYIRRVRRVFNGVEWQNTSTMGFRIRYTKELYRIFWTRRR